MEEYNAVKNNVGLFDFSMEGKIKITGEGRIDFINNLVSNDVQNLKINNGIYAAFLDRLGKILSDCVIYKFDGFLLINLSIIGKNNIIQKLRKESLMAKSEIEDLTLKYALFSLQGPNSVLLLNNILNEKVELKNQYQCIIKTVSINNNSSKEKNNKNNSIKNSKSINEINNNLKGNNYENNNLNNDEIEIMITKNRRTAEDGFDIFVPAFFYKEFRNLLVEKGRDFGLKIISNNVYNILRLEAKIPLFGIDFNDKNILNEITEKATDYTKGCFVGQEIVARIKNIAKGRTAKKLFYLEVNTNKPIDKNTKITKNNKEAGFVTSSAFSPELNKVIGFGFLYKEFYENLYELEINKCNAKVESTN